jgi:putative tryptophan/tyrosine transport system substrate-binding protein
MRRREFITLLGGAVTWPIAARAQQADRVRRVPVLMGYAESDPIAQAQVAAFRQRLQELGWTDGQNIRIDGHFVSEDPDIIRTRVLEVLGMAPDVIVVNSNLPAAAVVKGTRTVPIVFISVSDPIGSGFVASLPRPGGNVTGFANFEPTIGGKWLQTLTEIAPSVKRVALLLHPETPPNVGFLHAAEAAAPSFGVKLTAVGVHSAAEIERGITAFAAEPDGGLIVAPHIVTNFNRDLVIALAARLRLPTVYPLRYYATSGGLISYGFDVVDQFRRGAAYVDLVLRGAKPADLPVQQPIKFELVINLKTAKALGLDIPPTLLALADEVIE